MSMRINQIICLYVLLTSAALVNSYFGQSEDEDCFCQLQGKQIDDCSCNVDTVDHFNNVKVYPRLRSLLTKDYFRFYKVNLHRECPFWTDDSRCAMRFCHVEPCAADTIPAGLKEEIHRKDISHEKEKYYAVYGPHRKEGPGACAEPVTEDHNDELGYLNTTISANVQGNFALWQEHDDQLDMFCALNENDDQSEYVDLLLNPERFTGYKGHSAHRIWDSIYMENCFRPKKTISSFIQNDKLNGMCLEKRAFYRLISGLHSSINIHLSAKYLLADKPLSAGTLGEWGPNLQEFRQRFSPETTSGEGPNWLKNLYFIYLLELRALAKAAPYLQLVDYYTGNEDEDWDTKQAMKDLLNVVQQFPDPFDETVMFNGGGGKPQKQLKNEFIAHFKNITEIMDCVGCDKCKLWGKLQIQGLGTALKILFSGLFDHYTDASIIPATAKDFQLQRTEIVSLVNAIGRLSTSVYELDEFRQMIR